MRILCLGDSNTYGYDPRSFFGDRYPSGDRWVDLLAKQTGYPVINSGENGRVIPRNAYALRIAEAHTPADILLVMLGTNDLLQFWSPESACGKMERFLESLTLHREKLLLIAPPPLKLGEWVQGQKLTDDSITLTKQYQALSECLGTRFADAGQWNIPLAHDGVHMTQEGHRAFAEGLFNYLNKGE